MTVPSNGNAHGILLKIKKKKGKRNKRMDTKTRLRHQTSRSTLPVPEHTAWQDAAQELASQLCSVPFRGNSAPVAQSDRALASGAKGRAFESRRAHQNGIKDLDVKIWVLFSCKKTYPTLYSTYLLQVRDLIVFKLILLKDVWYEDYHNRIQAARHHEQRNPPISSPIFSRSGNLQRYCRLLIRILKKVYVMPLQAVYNAIAMDRKKMIRKQAKQFTRKKTG